MTLLKTLLCFSDQPQLICAMLKYAFKKVEPIKLTCRNYKKILSERFKVDLENVLKSCPNW